MSPEEFERLKEAEKAHLRKLKELKQAVRKLGRQQRVTDALHRMTTGAAGALDTQAEMVEKLSQETAQQQARMEIALEAEAERRQQQEADAALEAHEEEQRKARAQNLIRQMKQELGGPPEAPTAQGKTIGRQAAPEATPPAKTIGRPAPAEKADERPNSTDPPRVQGTGNPTAPGSRPEKTIGRM